MDAAAGLAAPNAEAGPVDWKARAKVRFSPTGVLLVEYEGIESPAPAHDDEYATPATPVPAAYPAPEAYHFPYTSEAVQALRCAACNRTFTSSNAVLQHLRDHAAHKDGPEAQEAAYVLQCQEAGLLGDPSAATSPAWGWPHDPQQPYQGTWWWQQQDAQHDGAQAQGAQATGSGSSPSNMSCNEHVDLDEDAAHQQHQHQQQQQQQQGANGFYPPRQPGGQGARGPGVGRRGKPLTGKAGAQQQQQQQQQQRGPGKRPQQLYQPPPPALHTYGYDSAFPPLAGGGPAPPAALSPAAAPAVSWAATAKVAPEQQQQQQHEEAQDSKEASAGVAAAAATDKPSQGSAPSSPTSVAGLRVSAPVWTPAA